MGNFALTREEIVACFVYKTFESADGTYCVFKFKNFETHKDFTAIGSMLPKDKNVPYRLTGNWGTSKKTGHKQFEVAYFEQVAPSGRAEIISYLSALHCGIGPVKAKAIWEHFGSKTWEILESDPARLLEIPLINRKTLDNFLKAQKENNIIQELVKLFSKSGVNLSGDTLHSLLEKYGSAAVDVLRENPFDPCGSIQGYSFDRADALACSLGYPMDSDNRLSAAIFKVLDDAALSGHVCLPSNELLELLIKFSGCTKERCGEAIKKAFREKKIYGANNYMYTPKRYKQEEMICSQIVRLIKTGGKPIEGLEAFISEYEASTNFTFADCQRDAIRNVFKHSFCVITGGPGVGKTTVIKGILAVHQQVFGASSEPVLLAPTGKASRRMSAATGAPAQTIHSAVGWRGEEFDYDSQEPVMLEGNLVIIDECSMMDQAIASILFSRIRNGARVVLVGDIDQLPSVGCGNVLSDLIKSEVIPVTRLTVIFRQAGENPIVKNAHAINNGNTNLEFSNSFRFITCQDEQEVFKAACKKYIKCVKAYGDDKVILLNPQRNNTFVSVDRFNTELQSKINPADPEKLEIKVGKTVFRENDKIMELKNNEEGPKNGDIGYIRQITRRKDPDDPNTFIYYANIEWNGDGEWIEYSQDDMRHVTLAYCTTVHKSQGEEYQNVIEVVSKAHPSMLKRNLVYTGITRAKTNVCLVGELDALSMAISNNSLEVRYTLLASRLNTALKSVS